MTARTVVPLVGVLLAAGRGHPPLLQQPPAKESARVNPYEQLDRPQRERAAQAGMKLFQRECSACHGQSAQGTRIAPPLASPTLRQIPPGAIFWVLRNGSLKHGMPSFAHLPEQQRWQIVTYLKTL
jgi:mono/diheme cytochrome c family protein